MILYMLYYSSSLWVRVPITIERVTRFVLPGSPLLGSYLAGYVLLIVGTVFYSIATSAKAIPTIAILPISLYLVQATGEPWFLLLVPLQCLLAIVLTRPGPRLVLEGFLISTAVLSIASLASIAHFAGFAGLEALRGYVLPLRIFWGAPGFISVVALAFIGIASLARRYTEPAGDSHGPGRARTLLYLSLSIPPIFIALTHLPSVNPRLLPVSVDTYFYASFLQRAEERGLEDALRSIYPDRPVYLNNYILSPQGSRGSSRAYGHSPPHHSPRAPSPRNIPHSLEAL